MPNHERNPLEELSALADEETEQEVGEEKEKTPHAAAVEAVPRGENCAVTAEEDLDFGVEEFEMEAVAEPEIAEDESDSDSLEELLDQLSDEETPAAVAGGEVRKNSTEELEAELEMDLDNLKLDDIDTTDVNLDDEDLLED